jgi:hypothetical protein
MHLILPTLYYKKYRIITTIFLEFKFFVRVFRVRNCSIIQNFCMGFG